MAVPNAKTYRPIVPGLVYAIPEPGGVRLIRVIAVEFGIVYYGAVNPLLDPEAKHMALARAQVDFIEYGVPGTVPE